MSKALCFFLLIFSTLCCLAQEPQNSIGFSVSGHYSSIFAHNQMLSGLKSKNPMAIQFDLFRQKSDQESFNLCNCYPQSGISLSYWNYGNITLGYGLQFAVFVEPQFKIYKNHFFILRATAGLTYLSNPFDSLENPNNMAYSLPVGGYVSFGPGWRYRINPQYSVFAAAVFNHISNGGIKDPNLGLNFPGVNIGLSRQLTGLTYDSKKTSSLNSNKKNEFDASVFFYSSRSRRDGIMQRFNIYGAELSYTYNKGKLISWTNAIEFYKDDVLKEYIRRNEGIDKERYRSGIMTGLRYSLGKFEFIQKLGFYIHDPDLFNGRIFHRHGLNYFIHPQWAAGIQLKAHNEVANFIDFRITHRIKY